MDPWGNEDWRTEGLPPLPLASPPLWGVWEVVLAVVMMEGEGRALEDIPPEVVARGKLCTAWSFWNMGTSRDLR